jgi:UDP-galactopyranose mutase
MNKLSIGMAGAGFSCAVIARALAEKGHKLEIFERRNHIAGNCHTERDVTTGVMTHMYGPHIFHTDDDEVWAFVNSFMKFEPFVNRVKATTGKRVYSLPINLHTINQFFGETLNPTQAAMLIQGKASSSIDNPANFEEQALKFVGRELYEAFFKCYTEKQWGVDPKTLPASILKRLPVRFNYNDNYFFHKYQGMPRFGYTELVRRILDHQNITVNLCSDFPIEDRASFDHVFYSGTMDGFFNYELGDLQYRTLDFEKFTYEGDFQGCAVMNYCDDTVPFTRVTEHKHFSPWEENSSSVCYKEFSRACTRSDIPYYPLNLVESNEMLVSYKRLAAQQLENVTFVGRLGTYKYMDMDVCIRNAMDTASNFLSKHT